MNKIKKVITGIGIFLFGLTSKVLGKDYEIGKSQLMYGVPSVRMSILPSVLEKIEKLLVCIFFIIGLFVIFNKKIEKRMKIIIVSVLLILIIIMNIIIFNH